MSAKVVLDFVGHTDFAAAIRPSYHCPGAIKLAAYFEHFRAQNPEGTVLLDAGDILCGAPIINLTHGEPVVDIVNLFGYDAMTLGNHEFDNGAEIMKKVLARANFPLLCANITERHTGELIDIAQPYLLLERKGVKIGILGVTTEYTPYMIKAPAFDSFEISDPVAACNRYIPQLRADGAQIVVVLGHLPGTLEEDGSYSGELFKVAEQVEGIDILFGGHNPGNIAVTLNGLPISKAGFSAQSIGHIQVEFDPATGALTCLQNEIVPVLKGDLAYTPDPAIATAVETVLQPYKATLDEVLGQAEDDLVVARSGEFSIGSFFTDSIRQACNAQVSFVNSTSCFGFMPQGPITAEMIMWVMCFNDHLYTGTVTGRQLRDLLEKTHTAEHLALNGDLQFSGFKAVIDTRRPAGQRVVSLTSEDGTPIADEQTFTAATSAYIASGGNSYAPITSQTAWQQTEHFSHPVLIDSMRRLGRLSAKTQGRLVNLAAAN